MQTKNIKASEVEEGDIILVDGELKLVEDIRENGRMNGVWLQMAGGHDRFYNYDDTVRIALDSDVEEIG